MEVWFVKLQMKRSILSVAYKQCEFSDNILKLRILLTECFINLNVNLRVTVSTYFVIIDDGLFFLSCSVTPFQIDSCFP